MTQLLLLSLLLLLPRLRPSLHGLNRIAVVVVSFDQTSCFLVFPVSTPGGYPPKGPFLQHWFHENEL